MPTPAPAKRPPYNKFRSQRASKPRPPKGDRPEDPILHQVWFKSIGPRTYAAQVKRASNGNQYLVLTEGKRDDETKQVKKTRLFLFSEDFRDFFLMLRNVAEFVRQNPMPKDAIAKRDAYWTKKGIARPDNSHLLKPTPQGDPTAPTQERAA